MSPTGDEDKRSASHSRRSREQGESEGCGGQFPHPLFAFPRESSEAGSSTISYPSYQYPYYHHPALPPQPSRKQKQKRRETQKQYPVPKTPITIADLPPPSPPPPPTAIPEITLEADDTNDIDDSAMMKSILARIGRFPDQHLPPPPPPAGQTRVLKLPRVRRLSARKERKVASRSRSRSVESELDEVGIPEGGSGRGRGRWRDQGPVTPTEEDGDRVWARMDWRLQTPPPPCRGQGKEEPDEGGDEGDNNGSAGMDWQV